MRCFSRRLLLPLLCLLCLVGQARALDAPPLPARVNDRAGILTPATTQLLESGLAQLEQEDSTQIAVLTIPSLEGDGLEDFALRVFTAWGLGQRRHDNGALLLVAVAERKVRIEVGYGLEERLTDMLCGRIIRHNIVPAFRQGDYNQGVLGGVAAMIEAVRGVYSAGPPGDEADEGALMAFLLMTALVVGRIFRRRQPTAAAVGALGGMGWGLVFPGSMPFWLAGLFCAVGSLIMTVVHLSSGTVRIRSGGGFSGGVGGGFGGNFDFGGGGFSGGGGRGGGGGASGGW